MQSNLMSKTIVAVTTAVLVGAGMLSPVSAATNARNHVRAAPTYEQQVPHGAYNAYNAYNQYGERSWASDRFNPSVNFGQGNRCVTDEGYGRWSYCDGGN